MDSNILKCLLTLGIERSYLRIRLEICALFVLWVKIRFMKRPVFIVVVLIAADIDDILMVRVLWSVFLCSHKGFIKVLGLSDELEKSFAVKLYLFGLNAFNAKKLGFIWRQSAGFRVQSRIIAPRGKSIAISRKTLSVNGCPLRLFWMTICVA